jgi:GYF domain 2
MADRWYYAHDDIKIGPFSGQQLRDLADTGQIIRTDTIWKEGIVKGVSALKVKNLFLPMLPNPPLESLAPVAQTEAESLSPGLKSMPTEGTPAETPVPTILLSTPLPDEIELHPEVGAAPILVQSSEQSPAQPPTPPPVKPKEHVKKGRAIAGKGVIICGQDGTNVKFKKKCTVCSHEDGTRNSLKITNGTTRLNFFCPKCKKRREVEILGYPG